MIGFFLLKICFHVKTCNVRASFLYDHSVQVLTGTSSFFFCAWILSVCWMEARGCCKYKYNLYCLLSTKKELTEWSELNVFTQMFTYTNANESKKITYFNININTHWRIGTYNIPVNNLTIQRLFSLIWNRLSFGCVYVCAKNRELKSECDSMKFNQIVFDHQ